MRRLHVAPLMALALLLWLPWSARAHAPAVEPPEDGTSEEEEPEVARLRAARGEHDLVHLGADQRCHLGPRRLHHLVRPPAVEPRAERRAVTARAPRTGQGRVQVVGGGGAAPQRKTPVESGAQPPEAHWSGVEQSDPSRPSATQRFVSQEQ